VHGRLDIWTVCKQDPLTRPCSVVHFPCDHWGRDSLCSTHKLYPTIGRHLLVLGEQSEFGWHWKQQQLCHLLVLEDDSKQGWPWKQQLSQLLVLWDHSKQGWHWKQQLYHLLVLEDHNKQGWHWKQQLHHNYITFWSFGITVNKGGTRNNHNFHSMSTQGPSGSQQTRVAMETTIISPPGPLGSHWAWVALETTTKSPTGPWDHSRFITSIFTARGNI
jgi:hypothetical protein